jgi:hypothetical protein
LEDVVLVVGLESLQEVSLLGILPLELTTGMGGVVALRRRGGTVHETPRAFPTPLPPRDAWNAAPRHVPCPGTSPRRTPSLPDAVRVLPGRPRLPALPLSRAPARASPLKAPLLLPDALTPPPQRRPRRPLAFLRPAAASSGCGPIASQVTLSSTLPGPYHSSPSFSPSQPSPNRAGTAATTAAPPWPPVHRSPATSPHQPSAQIGP